MNNGTFIPVFRDLIERYPTSAELEAFLESEAGGRLMILDRKEGKCIIRYEKGISNLTLPHVPWFRSVVWDTVHNRPLAISPPRKVSKDGMAAEALEWRKEPLLDGVMINAYATSDGTWDLSTRSRLGASGYFYSSKPFSQLFLEGLDGIASLEDFSIALKEGLKNTASAQSAVTVSYTFLLQHIENRNVTPHIKNDVFLLNTVLIDAAGGIIWYDYPEVIPRGVHPIPSCPITPLTWMDQGYVWRNGGSGRIVERNPAWQEVKDLRGNDASDLARFLRIYNAGTMFKYMLYFLDDAVYMTHYTEWMEKVIAQLGAISSAIRRGRLRKDQVDRMWWPHLDALKQHRGSIAQYFRQIPWHRVAHLIRKLQALKGMTDDDDEVVYMQE